VTSTPATLKTLLPRTWPPFFARYGNFTPAQLAAIPPLLDGHNVILCAATASGKTEAALAPLIERRLPPDRAESRLTLLYLLPTRALIADIANRLAAPLERLRVRLAVKTHDFDTFAPRRPADLLLTTPESLDALLATRPKTLTRVRAVVIDELHVLDGEARGDHLRVLLNRLRQVRAFAAASGDAPDAQIQYVALSATIVEPAAVAARYFPVATVVVTPGGRDRQLELRPLDADAPDELLATLGEFRARGWRKGLVFCNTRAEVEAYAAAVRTAGSPFWQQVYVHYSNLERQRRRRRSRSSSPRPAPHSALPAARWNWASTSARSTWRCRSAHRAARRPLPSASGAPVAASRRSRRPASIARRWRRRCCAHCSPRQSRRRRQPRFGPRWRCSRSSACCCKVRPARCG
jgi:ATP-dependent Lhr-like helicase